MLHVDQYEGISLGSNSIIARKYDQLESRPCKKYSQGSIQKGGYHWSVSESQEARLSGYSWDGSL